MSAPVQTTIPTRKSWVMPVFGGTGTTGGLASSTVFRTAVTLLFYTSITAFILFLILTFIHFTIYPIFSFSEEDDGIISIPTSSDQQKAFKGVIATPDLSSNFVAIPDCGYTIAFDTFLSGDFMATNAPRVLLYRSRTPVAMVSTDRESNLLDTSKFANTNLLVYLDPIKNDMNVAVVTSTGTNAPKQLRKLPVIENVPLRKVFRTTIVMTETFVEVYMNGQLAQSMPLTDRPLTQGAGFQFYTVPSLFGSNMKLANLSFWPRPLKARDVRAYGQPIATDILFTAPPKT
jgi:hypothetical protein